MVMFIERVDWKSIGFQSCI